MSKKTDRAASGGKARSRSMTSAQKSESARHAATTRWAEAKKDIPLPKETHPGVLSIASMEIQCSVLDTGVRVFSARALRRLFGSKMTGGGGGGAVEERALELPPFLASQSLFPFISEDLSVRLKSPILYVPKKGGTYALGYEATLLPDICEVILRARDAGALKPVQVKLADAADILVRGLARVGIIALIDEATGYQAERVRDELQTILQAYIATELLQWTKKFPDEFFRQVYRLQGWEYKEGNVARPGYVGKLINKYVYERLPPGVLDELRKKNPPINGRRQFKHFQFLTEQTGHPHLDKQIASVTTLMRAARNKGEFSDMFLRAYPLPGDQTAMILDPEDTSSP